MATRLMSFASRLSHPCGQPAAVCLRPSHGLRLAAYERRRQYPEVNAPLPLPRSRCFARIIFRRRRLAPQKEPCGFRSAPAARLVNESSSFLCEHTSPNPFPVVGGMTAGKKKVSACRSCFRWLRGRNRATGERPFAFRVAACGRRSTAVRSAKAGRACAPASRCDREDYQPKR